MSTGSISAAWKKAIHQLFFNYFKWLVLIALIVYMLSGIFKIDRDSIGVLTRFGQVVDSNVLPGLHYKFPWPIDRIETVPVKQVKTIKIQDFGSKFTLVEGGESYKFYNDTNLEPYCVTGDNNIVAITLVIKYTIDNPVDYLFGTKRPEAFIERSAANLIVHQMAHLHIDEVLTTGKKQLEFNLQNLLIEELEKRKTGVRISFLEIKEISPPDKVQEDFDRVINAEVEKKQMLNEAQGYLNRVVPEARTEADTIIQDAEAYKREKTLLAEGEASRFLSRLKGFNQNPEAHREKIYLEFIKTVFPKLNEIRVVDAKKGGGSYVVPLK